MLSQREKKHSKWCPAPFKDFGSIVASQNFNSIFLPIKGIVHRCQFLTKPAQICLPIGQIQILENKNKKTCFVFPHFSLPTILVPKKHYLLQSGNISVLLDSIRLDLWRINGILGTEGNGVWELDAWMFLAFTLELQKT